MNEAIVILNEDGSMEQRYVDEGASEWLWEIGACWAREEGDDEFMTTITW